MKKFYTKAQSDKHWFVHDLNIKVSKKYLGSLEFNPDRAIEVKEYPTFSDHESDMAVNITFSWKNLPINIADKVSDKDFYRFLPNITIHEVEAIIDKTMVYNMDIHGFCVEVENFTSLDTHSRDGITIDGYKDTWTFKLDVLINVEAENLDDMAETIEDLVDIQVKSLIETFYIIEGKL
jgi:hypothetical protein